MINSVGSHSENADSFTNGQNNATASQILLNFEHFSPEQKKEIKSALRDLSVGWQGEYEKPFRTFEANNISAIDEYLKILTLLFSAGTHQQDVVRKAIIAFIERAKTIVPQKNDAKPVEKVLFLQHPERIHDVNEKYGDKINAANNVDIWDEDGNGGYYDKIDFPGGMLDDFSGNFCLIHATENKLTQRPNAIVIVLNGEMRKKFRFLQWQYFQPHAVKFFPDAVEKAWEMTDKEVFDTFSLPDTD